MNALATHLDDLLTVLRASADLDPTVRTPLQLQGRLADELDHVRSDLAARIRDLDEWHAEVLADFIADAHVVAAAMERPMRERQHADDTRVG